MERRKEQEGREELTQERQGELAAIAASERGAMRYNQAVLLFALQRQATAGQVLEVLFHHADPVDDWVAMRSGFLLLEICVHAYRVRS